MSRKRQTPEQIIGKLREAEVSLSGGQTVPEVCRSLSVSEQTYYRRRKEYGGLKIEQARRFKELERENLPLRRAVADPMPSGRLSKRCDEILWPRFRQRRPNKAPARSARPGSRRRRAPWPRGGGCAGRPRGSSTRVA